MCQIDYPVLIGRLKKAGFTSDELAKEIGINKSTLNRIESEALPIPGAWNQAATLIDLHFRMFPKTYIPMMFEHNEV